MNDISQKLILKCINTLEEYEMLSGASHIVVGISGGADSVCLLHILASLREKYNTELIGAHINHGIRGEEAKRDSDFARSVCENLGVRFEMLEADCPAQAAATGETLEECGRRVRYEFFNSLCTDSSYRIATAHNADDNAETVIFNLTRGSALKGAAGIPPVRGNIIRPLIDISRDEIECYCDENSLRFVTDSTNLSDDYTRNKIRHSVIPVLKQLNPAVVGAFSRFSSAARSDASFIEKKADGLFEKAEIADFTFDRAMLLETDFAVVSRFVSRAVFGFCGKSPDYEKITAVCSLIKTGGKLQLYSDCYCSVDVSVLRLFSSDSAACGGDVPAPIKLSLEELPFTAQFGDFSIYIDKYTNNSKKIHYLLLDNSIDCDKISGDVVLRTRLPGDKITLGRRGVTKTLKKLFNEAAISPESRNGIPVISDENGVIWVSGFGADKRCRPTADSKKIISVKGEK